VPFDDDRPRAAPAAEIGDCGADHATAADHDALDRAHIAKVSSSGSRAALARICSGADLGKNIMSAEAVYLVTIWAIPVIIAITFHEASHGFVAHLLGDDTAWRLGRVTFNPFKHVDPFGTILLPGLLLLLRSPFVFGYAKPVPVNFRALRSPRRDMVLVAAAGPVMNIALAVAAALAFHLVGYLPGTSAHWAAENLKNALIINVVLAVFNLFPLPPLDGGRILVGILPKPVAAPVARLEPYGLLILIGLFIVLPLLGAQLGIDLGVVSRILAVSTMAIIEAILHVTGNI
jgi:Zn-dependent protease